MNFGSDQRVRDAFRATLQSEASSASILGTQEIDAADVLEVTDLANAIARAEEVIRARSSRVLVPTPDSSPRQEDIFDKLVAATPDGERAPVEDTNATDDTVGPAVHVPYRPTPLPPRTSNIPLPPGVLRPATLLRAPDDVLATPIPAAPNTPRSSAAAARLPLPAHAPSALAADEEARAPVSPVVSPVAPSATATIPPAARTAPILILDEDAFYHPAGRIRTLADVTLDGYRPEPTLMLRLRARRQSLTWTVAAVIAVLALFAIFTVAVGFGRASVEAPPVHTTAGEMPAKAPALAEPASQVERPVKTVEAAEPAARPVNTATGHGPASDVPVFDVNSLKNAPPARR